VKGLEVAGRGESDSSASLAPPSCRCFAGHSTGDMTFPTAPAKGVPDIHGRMGRRATGKTLPVISMLRSIVAPRGRHTAIVCRSRAISRFLGGPESTSPCFHDCRYVPFRTEGRFRLAAVGSLTPKCAAIPRSALPGFLLRRLVSLTCKSRLERTDWR
jgi:hypothetical protein